MALVDTVAILDADLRPRFMFPDHGLRAGFRRAGDTSTRLGDWVHPDDYGPIVAAFETCRRSPNTDVTVGARAKHDEDGWHVMTLAFRNLLDHPDVQGVLVRAIDHTVFEREARLRMLVAESPVGIYQLAIDGRCTFVNPQWCRLAGCRSEVALGFGWREFLHPDDLLVFDDQLQRAVSDGASFVGEFRFRHADGLDVWVSAHATPLVDHHGTVTGYLGTVEDVTSRRLMADLVAANDERVRRLLESSNDIVVVIDEHGLLTYCSPAAERVLGRRPEDHVGRPVYELLHPDDVRWVSELIGLAVQYPGPFPPEQLRVKHADGSWREVEITTTNLMSDSAVGGLLVNVRDLTERRRAAARLHEAEARFEQVFEHATVGIHVLDCESRFLRVNRATCLMLGSAEQYLLESTLFSFVHPDDLESVTEAHRTLLAGERSSYSLTLRLRRFDGEWIWGRASASVVRDDGGLPLHLVSQIEDVTEQHHLAERLAYDATHDRLTGLASRPVLFDHLDRGLARVRRGGTEVAVLFIDLDGFKRVNDTLGHAVGDDLLIQVAQRLRGCVRGSDVVVRLGGDEFVIYCAELQSAHVANELAERVLEVIAQPFVVDGHELSISGSIGIATARGDEPISGEQLLSNADVASYRAKRRGRGRADTFDDDLRKELSERRRVVRTVSRLLEDDRLPLLLSPIVRLADRRVVGFDCELDWVRAGLHDAHAATRVFAETGMARAMDLALIQTTLELLARWEIERDADAVPGLSIALTPSTVLAPDFPNQVRELLGQYEARRDRCWLGVPEAALAQDLDGASRAVHAFCDLGVGVALRDFGAGVSSLEQLRRLPAKTVTFAGRLVDALAGEDDVGTALVTSVLRFARALGRMTLATGVVAPSDAERLAQLGCDYGSGAAFGPARRPDDAALS